MPKLNSLEANNNRIADINAIGQLALLKYISLSDNRISSLDVVTNLTQLNWLGVQNNLITDLGPLVAAASQGGLARGTYVGVGGNPLSDF
ncbi:MAG: leucine-rich repeat domain-containing protein, partial [Chloroflexi bacterium]|nr:leucine-rich repeat domain-containing protein [Chloroflexota bacterium]